MLLEIILTTCLTAPSARFVRQIDGFLEPTHAIWLPDGNIAIADRMADEIIVIKPDGARLHSTPHEGVQRLHLGEDGVIVGVSNSKSKTYPTWATIEVRARGYATKTKNGWFIPDIYGHAIHQYDLDGTWLGKWGVHAVLPHEGEGKLHYPNAVSVSPDGKQIIVCEGFEGRIQIFDLGEGDPEAPPTISNISHFGKQIDSYGDLIVIAEPELGDVYLFRTGLRVPMELTRFGGEGDAPHQFKWVNGVWIGDSTVLVVGNGNLKTFVFEHSAENSFKQLPGMVKFQKLQKHEKFNGPIDVDSKSNPIIMPNASDFAITKDGKSMWSVDGANEKVMLLKLPEFKILQTIEGFIEPQGIAIEKNGNILVSDIGASHIKRFSPEGELLLTFGEKGFEPEQMYKPAGMTVLDDGTICVVDWGNHRAQFYDPDGSWKATFGRGRSWTR